jgi:hypothetical protein
MELVDVELEVDVPLIVEGRLARNDMANDNEDNRESGDPVDFDQSALFTLSLRH